MTRIKTSTKSVTIYTVAGKQFLDETDALAYEKELNEKMDYTYHVVKYGPLEVDSFVEDKTPVYSKCVIYAVPVHATPSNLIYTILMRAIGEAVTEHVDEFGCQYGLVNNWIITLQKRLYSIESVAEFFNSKIDDSYQPLIRFVDETGSVVDEWKRDGLYVKRQSN